MQTPTIAMALCGGLALATISCGRIGYQPLALVDAQVPGQEWLAPDWQYRKRFNIPASAIPEPLAGFPVYLQLADLGPEFAQEVQSLGADIRITASDGLRELPYELVGIDTVAGTGQLYFQADLLSSTSENVFYIYYGNPNASARTADAPLGSRGVWNNGFVAVYHLEERPDLDGGCGPGKACNAALAQHVGDIGDDFTAEQLPGHIGGSLSFDGNNDYVDVPSLSRANFPQNQGTLSILFKLDCNVASPNQSQLFDRFSSSRNHFFMRCSRDLIGKNFQMAAAIANSGYAFSESFVVNEQGWNIVTVRYDTINEIIAVFLDGAIVDTAQSTAGWRPTDQDFVLGATTGASPIGQIDETRFSNVVRSDAWIQAEYDNLLDTSRFYQVFGQETQSAP